MPQKTSQTNNFSFYVFFLILYDAEVPLKTEQN